MAIQFRRGDYDDMDANALLDGEPVVTTQDDPNASSGRGFYIKIGDLYRILTNEDNAALTSAIGGRVPKAYRLLNTVTLSSNKTVVDLGVNTYIDPADEYLIVIDGTVSVSSGAVYIEIGDTNVFFKLDNNTTLNKACTIKKIVNNDALVTTDTSAKIADIENVTLKLKTGAISIQSGTVIKIYVRG